MLPDPIIYVFGLIIRSSHMTEPPIMLMQERDHTHLYFAYKLRRRLTSER